MDIYQRDVIEDTEFKQPSCSIHNEYSYSDEEIDDSIQSNQTTSRV